jgi:RNA polymerase sigma factor (sigma-70 family)
VAESFDSFFRSDYQHIVRAVASFTSDPLEAEDLVQEAMFRAYLRWAHVSRMTSPSGYVYQSAANLYRTRMRRRRALERRHLLPSPAIRDLTADPAVARSDLASALASLAPGQRDALLLVEWFGLRSDVAAGLLGVRPSTVRSRASRARAALMNSLGGSVHGGNDE